MYLSASIRIENRLKHWQISFVVSIKILIRSLDTATCTHIRLRKTLYIDK